MTVSRDDDYRSAGFAGRLGFGAKPALLVIDMMMAYFDRASPMYAGVEEVANSNGRLIAAARQADVPIIYTRQFYEGRPRDSVYASKVPVLQLLAPESPPTQLEPSLPTDGATVLVKHYPSAFHKTDLADRLRSLGVDTLILTGLTTSGCVRATAMDTMLNGFLGAVVREAVGDRNKAQHEANLFDIDAKLVDVRSEADVLVWLRSMVPVRE